MRNRRALAFGAVAISMSACAMLPDGRPAPVSPEAQLLTLCTALAGVSGELARAIDRDRLSPGEVEQVKYLKPVADEACLPGGGDPTLVLERARQALQILDEIERSALRASRAQPPDTFGAGP